MHHKDAAELKGHIVGAGLQAPRLNAVRSERSFWNLLGGCGSLL